VVNYGYAIIPNSVMVFTTEHTEGIGGRATGSPVYTILI